MQYVWEIERLSFPYPYSHYLFYNFLTKLFFVIEVNGKIVGYVVGDKERKLIISIAVHPSYRRRGYGRKLIEHVMGLMGGFAELQVRKSNEGAINFYKKLGFREIKVLKRYYQDGEDAILMRFSKV